MKIDEAVKQALEQNKCIMEKDYPYVKMLPVEGMPLIIMKSDGSNPRKRKRFLRMYNII